MKLIQRVIYTGFAAIAITSASMPVWPAEAITGPASVPGTHDRAANAASPAVAAHIPIASRRR